AQESEVRHFTSPNDRIHISIQMPLPGSTERSSWAASFHGKPILTNCSFGLQTTDTGELMAGVRVVRERRRSVDRRIPVLFGKSAYANDSFHETRFTFETPRHRRLDVTFRR